MKAKRPLLLGMFVVVLLVALIALAGVASAAPEGSHGAKPVNWVSANFVCSPTADLPVWTMDAIYVEKLQNGTVRGLYLDQSLGKPGPYSYRYSSRNFESAYWDAFQAARGLPSLSHAYFCHGANYPAALWPTYFWMGLPPTFATFANADIADFVAYVPADQLDPASRTLFPDSMPVRYVLMDFGRPCKANDRYMAWIFVPSDPDHPNDPNTVWLWYPMSVPDDPVLFARGDIQVRVGAPDF